jgi:hypothetical protein
MENNNNSRILTLTIKILDDAESGWIWENLKGNKSHGIDVFFISEGNMTEKLDLIENAIDDLEDLIHGES